MVMVPRVKFQGLAAEIRQMRRDRELQVFEGWGGE